MGTSSLTYFIYNKTKQSTAQEAQQKTALHVIAGLIHEELFTVQVVLLKRTDLAECTKPTN